MMLRQPMRASIGGRTRLLLALVVASAALVQGSVAQDASAEGETETGAAGRFELVPTVPLDPTPVVHRSKSTSGQFVIYSALAKTRGAFSGFAEGVKSEYLSLLGQRDQWVYPIVIEVDDDGQFALPDEVVHSNYQQIDGGGFRFGIRVAMSPHFDREVLRRELVRALMAEHILRGQRFIEPSAGRGQLMPTWLFAGICEALEFRRGTKPHALFTTILSGGRTMDIDTIFEADPDRLDSVSRAVYEASCGALVLTLLDRPSGGDGLAELLGSLSRFRGDDHALLAKAYPGFRVSRDSVTKWWALKMATLAGHDVFQILPVAQTEARLKEATILHIPAPGAPPDPTPKRGLTSWFPWGKKSTGGEGDGAPPAGVDDDEDGQEGTPLASPAGEGAVPDGGSPTSKGETNAPPEEKPLDEFHLVIAHEDRARIVRSNQLRLLELGQRGHPLLRPVVEGYLEVFQALGEGKDDGLAEKIAALAGRRAEILADARAAEDYLDWFEATQQTEDSGAFDEYRRTVEEMRREQPGRTDPITRYLDAVEAIVE